MSQAPSSTPVVKFNSQDRPEFFRELKSRVNQYFEENNISKHGTTRMKVKTVFMLLLYFSPFVVLCLGLGLPTWAVILMWAIMGVGSAGLGLSVMHDANHGAYSDKKWINDVLSRMMNVLGGSHLTWRIQHNVLHHMFTNVDGFDEDLETGVMRMSPNQKRRSFFKFQVWYAPVLYGIMTIFKIFVKDYIQIFKYSKNNLLKRQGRTLAGALVGVTVSKLIYFTLMLGLPVYVGGLSWGLVILGWFVAQFVGGMLMALIFQSAHVLEETNFYVPDENGSVENNWAIHQLHTTANFANGSTWFSWFVGGLNYQVEHHLFPTICHIHFRALSPIVKQTAEEYGLPYHHNTTFASALADHFRWLGKMGHRDVLREISTADMG